MSLDSLFFGGKGRSDQSSGLPGGRPFSLHKFLMYLAAGVFVLWVAASPLVWGAFYDRLIFPADKTNYDSTTAVPIRQLHDELHVETSDISIKLGNGKIIDGWYFKCPNAQKVVLVAHGNGGSKYCRLPFIATLLMCGTNVMIYDYEGYGKSTGEPTLANVTGDSLVMYDYLIAQRGYKPAEVIVCGESIGTGVASYIAQRRKVGGIVLASGFTTLHDEGYFMMPWLHFYPTAWLPGPNLDNLAMVADRHAPLLLVHGDADQIVPCSFANTLYERAAEPKQLLLIKNAGHRVLVDPYLSQFAKEFKKFLAALH